MEQLRVQPLCVCHGQVTLKQVWQRGLSAASGFSNPAVTGLLPGKEEGKRIALGRSAKCFQG